MSSDFLKAQDRATVTLIEQLGKNYVKTCLSQIPRKGRIISNETTQELLTDVLCRLLFTVGWLITSTTTAKRKHC